jgi:hypothetical protein
MKKIILSLVLVFISICSFSQSPVQLLTYKNQVCWKNKNTNEVSCEKYVYSTLTFSFYEEYISVNDEGHSIYRITEDIPVINDMEKEITKAVCYDEKNRKCIVALIRYKNKQSSSITVMYDDRMFVYVVDMEK